MTVVVNAAMRSRYERLLAAFKRAQGAELVQWDAAYEAIDAILSAEPPRYLAGGFKSARAITDAVLPGITLDTLRDNARVARYFDPDAEKKHAVARLALLLDYLEAKNGGALPAMRVEARQFKDLGAALTRASKRGAPKGGASSWHALRVWRNRHPSPPLRHPISPPPRSKIT